MVIAYSECGLNPDFDYADMSSEVMSLEHIHDEDELRNFIFGWSGNCITFTNCSCLTDDILRVLEELDWNYLDIMECSGFTVGGLRDCLEAKRRRWRPDAHTSVTYGCPLVPLTRNDEVFLKKCAGEMYTRDPVTYALVEIL